MTDLDAIARAHVRIAEQAIEHQVVPNPQTAQVHATLAVEARLQQIAQRLGVRTTGGDLLRDYYRERYAVNDEQESK